MCKTAGTIEAWNYILKRIDHTEKHMRPDVFIRNHYPGILERQRQFYDDLHKSSRKRLKVSTNLYFAYLHMHCLFCYRPLSPKKVLALFVKNGQREKSNMMSSIMHLDIFNRSHLNHSLRR